MRKGLQREQRVCINISAVPRQTFAKLKTNAIVSYPLQVEFPNLTKPFHKRIDYRPTFAGLLSILTLESSMDYEDTPDAAEV